MAEWKVVKLADVCTVLNGRAYSQPELLNSGKYKVVRVGNLVGGDRFYYSDMELDEDKYCLEGDLLYAWACSFDSYIWKEGKTIFHYHIWKLLPKEDLLDKKFFYFYLKRLTQKLLGKTNGSVMQHITKNLFENTVFPLPPLPTQQKIAAILSSLDDKIELNNKINENLEQQAQALFKSWFVDFEPFGGKMPEGWKVGKLSEIAEITMGQSPDGKSYNEDGIGTVFYQGRAEFGTRFPTRRLFTTEPKRMAKKFDTLMSVRAPVGDTNIANEDCCIGRGLAAIQSKDKHQSFVHYTALSLRTQLDIFNGEGTVFGCINRNALNNMEVVIPSKEDLDKFEQIIASMDADIFNRSEENSRLKDIRDTLLPKLMNGEIKI